ncbi:hypothetical protein [Vogesella sp. LIG4]|uniref:COG4315 family predicted lipoprotein n=1 Tax=Vogesella sp. LIG4 TaxID=1192162 RepID=UPI00081FBF55|nr:hypothetical protein [Vogesella sp. LIG4]SCK27609.1 Predicted lipoprotein with conserved Yx(FWY)xxD motif [Vogesella sp. LIG4]
MKQIMLLLALVAGGVLPAMAEQPEVGKGMLVDEHHMTLYVFDKDKPGNSACNEGCSSSWLPVVADAYDKAAGKWSMFKRADGKMQWAYQGRPLYRWSGDSKPGEHSGDGMGGMWHVARP